MRDSFIRQLTELTAHDKNIVLMTADLGFGVLDEFAKRYPRQYVNVGVAEQNMTGIATGLALEGRVVFTYSIANFPTLRCLEQLRNDVCYHRANVKVVAIGGGFSYGSLGFSHHATEDLSVLRSLSGLTVVAPGDDWETEEATRAFAQLPGPGYLRLDKSTAGNTQRSGEQFRLGQARVLREGKDCTFISTGGILSNVLSAADRLKELGINCRVLSMHTIAPLDVSAVYQAAQQTGAIITVEEHTVVGGLGGAVAEICLEQGVIPRLFRRMGIRERISPVVGDQEFLRKQHGLDTHAIVQAVISLVQQKNTESFKTTGVGVA